MSTWLKSPSMSAFMSHVRIGLTSSGNGSMIWTQRTFFFKIMRRTKNHFWEDSPCAPCSAPCRCSADPVLHQEVFVRGGLHQGIEKDFNCHVNRWQQQSNKAAMVRPCPQEAAAAGAAPSLALTKIGDVSSAWRKWQSMGFNLVILQLYKGL